MEVTGDAVWILELLVESTMKIAMASSNDKSVTKEQGNEYSQIDEAFTFNLQVYDDDASSEYSSGRLEIDVSESDIGEGREHKRKRSDDDDEEEDDNDGFGMPEVLNNMEEEIERQLDSKAAKSNLTVANVKNILKHVITNEHVLAMVRHSMKGNEGTVDMCQSLPYTPKLTRAKTKELLMTLPTMAWPMTPMKKSPPSKCQVLINQELLEDSSDEEYHPNEEEQSEDEKENENENESLASDLDSQPATPASVHSSAKPLTINDCATQTSWTDDNVFKKPQENIGQRTRSKLSLSDTPLETIERAFIPPDITTDMYDSECDDEDWKNFLQDFTEPLLTDLNDAIDDDEADPEYNVLADEETVDKEELRVDRAVKIPRKELNALMDELFEYADMMSSDDEEPRSDCLPSEVDQAVADYHNSEDPLATVLVDSDNNKINIHRNVMEYSQANIQQDIVHEPHQDDIQAYLEEIELKPFQMKQQYVPQSGDLGALISKEQKLLIHQQMRKLVQFLTQSFLQTYCHPELSKYAAECKSHLVTLNHLTMGNINSTFCASNLYGAIELIEKWEQDLPPNSEKARVYTSFIAKEIHKGRELKKKRVVYICKFPTKFLDTISRSKVFMYPLILPPMPFRCDGLIKRIYLECEDELIALGLEQFMEYANANLDLFPKKWNMRHVLPFLTEYLLPSKDHELMYFHIKKYAKKKMNPIKFYFDHKRAPGTNHFIIPFYNNEVKAPNEQPISLLPEVWRLHIHPV